MLVFDDSFEHEVIHESEGQRIVLIIDFHHPDMSQVNTKTLSFHLEFFVRPVQVCPMS